MPTKVRFKYFVAIPVWGKYYVNTFLESSLPTLMAEGNLPFLIKNCTIQIRIYTSDEDAVVLMQHPLIQKLQMTQDLLVLNIITLPKNGDKELTHLERQTIYNSKSNAYKDNIQHAISCSDHTGVIVSLNADIIFSNSFFMRAHEILSRGKLVIEVSGPRGKQTEISNALRNQYLMSDGSINIPADKLLDLWIEQIHPLLKIHDWNGDSKIFNSSHLMWKVGQNGWLLRCFYLYPIIMIAPKNRVKFSGTIDHDLVQKCGYRIDQVYIESESTSMFCCELSDESKFVGHSGERGNIRSIRYRYDRYGSEYNYGLLQSKILLGHNFDPEQLSSVATQSDLVVKELSRNFKARLYWQKVLNAARAVRNIKTHITQSKEKYTQG